MSCQGLLDYLNERELKMTKIHEGYMMPYRQGAAYKWAICIPVEVFDRAGSARFRLSIQGNTVIFYEKLRKAKKFAFFKDKAANYSNYVLNSKEEEMLGLNQDHGVISKHPIYISLIDHPDGMVRFKFALPYGICKGDEPNELPLKDDARVKANGDAYAAASLPDYAKDMLEGIMRDTKGMEGEEAMRLVLEMNYAIAVKYIRMQTMLNGQSWLDGIKKNDSPIVDTWLKGILGND